MNLMDRRAVVTGGSDGIGREICTQLAAEGCYVTNVCKNPESKEGLPPIDGLARVESVKCDIRNIAHLQEVVKKVRPQILINSAGILPLDDFLTQDLEDYEDIMNTNFRGALFATQQAIRSRDGELFIINISSTSGIKADPDTPIYGASKAAVVSLTESIAGQYGDILQCVAICPGFIDTMLVVDGPPIPKSELAKVPMGRLGQPSEIASVIISILKYGTYMNGSIITIDGGRCHGVWRWGK